jgi:hypothetical protein
MTMILDGSNGVTFNDASLQGAAASPFVLKNRIINGDMVIDQRNAGASVTINATANIYTIDRFRCRGETSDGVYTCQQDSDAPNGFTKSAKITVTTADASLAAGQIYAFQQLIEGFNTADLAWGTASAKTVTLSFWVKSSVTGTFGGSFRNSASDRSYPFTYTISVADTWEYKTITIAGDTSGTWLTTNGVGIILTLGFGVSSTVSGTAGAWSGSNFVSATGATNLMATSGATFYITGVQLEQNTSATPFERRLYGQELANCQRYFSLTTVVGSGIANGTTAFDISLTYPVQMRSAPTITARDIVTITDSILANYAQSSASISVFTNEYTFSYIRFNNFTGLTNGKTYLTRNGNSFINVSAEL